MKQRIQEIENQLTAFSNKRYSKEEILPELLLLQKQMAAVAFNVSLEETNGLKLIDISKRLEQLNVDCGSIANETVDEFIAGSKAISHLIKAEVSGIKGEKQAYKSLQTIRRKHRIIKNVELRHENHGAEIDMVVVVNNAVFLIEVKNSMRDIIIDEKGNYLRYKFDRELSFDKNIGQKMNEKEYLLREVLKNAGYEDVAMQSLLVFTNNSISVENNYEYIRTCFLSDLPHIINNYVDGEYYGLEQMQGIVNAITSAKSHVTYRTDEVDFPAIKRNFATLIATLEEAQIKRSKKHNFFNMLNRLARVACFMFN